MKTLFWYCYYRISKAYKISIDETGYYIYGSGVLFFAIGCIILAILAFLFRLLSIEINVRLFAGIMGVILVLSVFFISKKKYKQLEIKYKNEKNKKLKGWLVFLFIIGSFIMSIISVNVFGA